MKNITISAFDYTLNIEYDENKTELEDVLKECLKTIKTFKHDSMLEYEDKKEFNMCGAW